MSQQFRYEVAGIGMLRAPVLPVHASVPTADGPAAGEVDVPAEESAAGLTASLRALAADPFVREAVAVSSPSLAGLLSRVLDAGEEASLPQLRRAVRALTLYRLRMSTRATPFGLMAGVAPVRFAGPGEAPAVRFGAAHRRAVRPDREWLTGLVAAWERRPDVLRRLEVVANSLCRVRGGRLVLPYVPQSAESAESAEGGHEADARTVQDVSVRHTSVVAAVLELARRPVLGAELAQGLLERFPGATAQAVDGVLAQLVGKEILLTRARPPLEEVDPLGYVLRASAGIPGQALPERAELTSVKEGLERYAATPLGHGGPALGGLSARMRRLHGASDPLHVDLALDAEARLPAAVAAEAARAAELLWRLAPRTAGPAHLREYHRAFLERYGTDRLVSLTDVLDPAVGLGAPAGYLRPPSTRSAPADPPDQERDRALAALAQQAVLTGDGEVVLDEDHPLVRLPADAHGLPPASLEVGAHLLAADADALAGGDFRLVLANGSRQAGAMLGRFGYLMGKEAEAEVAALVREGEEASPGDALRAQVAFRPGRSRVGNVAQVPRWLDRLLPVGCFADPDDPGVLDPRDLSVRADHERLHLAEAATGRPVAPAVFHMLNPRWDLPNAARFVCEVAASGRRRWQMWHWSGAEMLPHLPRVRYGRTVLSPARWRPDAELRDPGAPFARWWEAFRRWQRQWRVPDRVQVGWADRYVQLDLARPGHPELLRHELLRTDQSELRETPADAAGAPDGWLRGAAGTHHAEVVIPLRRVPRFGHSNDPEMDPASRRPSDPVSRSASGPAPRRRPAPARPPGTVHLPGGEWLQASLYAPAQLHEELLAAHLPPLLGDLPAQVDRWFFLRYSDAGGPHLRLRFHAPSPVLARQLLPRLHQTAAALHESGMIGRVVWDSYDPELERYGGPEAMAAAERVFHADSVAVLEHLRRRYDRRDATEPLLLAAAGFADLARAFHETADAAGEGDAEGERKTEAECGGAAWLLRSIAKDEECHQAFRRRRRQALPLIDPYRPGPGPAADETLRALWERRAEATARYGHLLRELEELGPLGEPGARCWSEPDHVLSSLLHMHHNRLVGADRDAERLAHAVARGAAQAHTDRARHAR
ncbi:lantibiotic dehydratase [Streptomyces sp. NPDC050610]|uniref:lantibiotic dehydratase n=1 Tax=Streptomyces sp. NPDC050610 TaxID=3157097 RepID=UPI00342C845C